jgi:hypothetical protein
MKTIYLAAALLVSGLAAQAQTAPATTGATNTTNPPPLRTTPVPASAGTLNQATVDMKDPAPADAKMKRSIEQVKTTDKTQSSGGKQQKTTKKRASSTKSSSSVITTQPTTPPRP